MDKKKTAAEIVREAEEKLQKIGEVEKNLRIKEKEALDKLKMCDKLEELLEDKRRAKIKLIKFKKMILRELAYAREAKLALQQKKPMPPRPPRLPNIDPTKIIALVATTTAAIAPIAVEIAQLDSMLKEFNETNKELKEQAHAQYEHELKAIANNCKEEGELKFQEALALHGPERAEEIRTAYQAVADSILRQESYEAFKETYKGIDASEIWGKYSLESGKAKFNINNKIDELQKASEDFAVKHDEVYQKAMDKCEAITNEFIDKASPPEIEMDERLKSSIKELKLGIAEHCLTNNLNPSWHTDDVVFLKDGQEIEPNEIKIGDTIEIKGYVDEYGQDVSQIFNNITEISTAGDIVVLMNDTNCFTNLDIYNELESKKIELGMKEIGHQEVEDHNYEIGIM